MTTSHGGLLQVESTFESVEEAKQNFDHKQNSLKIKAKRKRRKPLKKNANKGVESSSQNVGIVPQYADPGAVMAAVGKYGRQNIFRIPILICNFEYDYILIFRCWNDSCDHGHDGSNGNRRVAIMQY